MSYFTKISFRAEWSTRVEKYSYIIVHIEVLWAEKLLMNTFNYTHSAVESDINALEVHGLDKCPDEGLIGFKRYVALAVLGSNLHRLGKLLQEQDRKKLRLAG